MTGAGANPAPFIFSGAVYFMKQGKFDLTIWHKLGIYFGMAMVTVGGFMYIPTYVHHKLQVEKRVREQGSPVWLELNNLEKRKRYFDECRSMPKLEGDISDVTCLSEANSLFPNRNWKEVAAMNMKEGV